MKHPIPEEWMSYLYDECGAAEKRQLDSHLADCAECRSQVTVWRGAQDALGADRASLVRPGRPVVWRPMALRALAAAAVLALGIGLGRLGTMSRADLRNEMAAVRQQWEASWRQQRAAEDHELMVALQKVAADNQRWLGTLRQEWAVARREDQRGLQLALQRLEDRHQSDHIALQAGLLQLARETGSGFEQTQTHVNQLASYLPENTPP